MTNFHRFRHHGPVLLRPRHLMCDSTRWNAKQNERQDQKILHIKHLLYFRKFLNAKKNRKLGICNWGFAFNAIYSYIHLNILVIYYNSICDLPSFISALQKGKSTPLKDRWIFTYRKEQSGQWKIVGASFKFLSSYKLKFLTALYCDKLWKYSFYLVW